jgi:hypothetical protein
MFWAAFPIWPHGAAAQAKGALLIAVVTEPVALGLIESPGTLGADIVVGEGQSLGVGLQFGGPYLGLFGCREKYVRQMPGRLCGETVDADGKRAFVLTLSTREQHIRREKATSNICTNSGLCALAFSIHMSLLGGKAWPAWPAPATCARCRRRRRWPGCPAWRSSTRPMSTNSPSRCRARRPRWWMRWRSAAFWAVSRFRACCPARATWRTSCWWPPAN